MRLSARNSQYDRMANDQLWATNGESDPYEINEPEKTSEKH